MDNSTERKRRKSRARERAEQREQRRQALNQTWQQIAGSVRDVDGLQQAGNVFSKVATTLGDAWWYLRKQKVNRLALRGAIAGGVVIALLMAAVLLLRSEIGPRISTMDVALGGQSIEAASERLTTFWENDLKIRIVLDGRTVASVPPADIGLQLDADATAQAAKEAGLSGLLFGYDLPPVIDTSYGTAQTYMLALGEDIFIPAYEAGYMWDGTQIVGQPGTPSLELDVPLTVQRLVDNPLDIVETRQINLVTSSTPPRVLDPSPYLAEAEQFVTSDFALAGFDPFTNDRQSWATTREQMARWLVATDSGLRIREETIDDFVGTINNTLDTSEWPRYLDPEEARTSIESAFRLGESAATIRIRYANTTYALQSGDWGYRLSRRTGLPFVNIDQANPTVDWNATVVGQRINLPSRDLVMPLEPVLSKRIVVDMQRMWLVAYENEEPVFHWPISIGRSSAPTAPGIFQILEKVDVAYGSSFDLCNDAGDCGQWEMNYFMSIYEVGGGLLNGFHGAVRLPNGAFLDGGSSQIASTYGCVMSDDEQARMLYEWAEVGTVVEIISSDYPPQSDIAQLAIDFIAQVSGQS